MGFFKPAKQGEPAPEPTRTDDEVPDTAAPDPPDPSDPAGADALLAPTRAEPPPPAP